MKIEGCFPGMEHLQYQLKLLQDKLGGDIEVDLSLTSIPLIKYRVASSPSPFISQSCDLDCYSFDALGTPPCKWHNEINQQCLPNCEDSLDFVRAKNSWGREQSALIFGTEKTASKYYIISGTDVKMSPEASVMLVSNPIQCQEGDGEFIFKYWTSPGVSIQICTRRLGSQIKEFAWCSGNVTIGDPGPINLMIPGSIMYNFELVLIARGFNFDAFGSKGGIAIIDDIIYKASSVQNCANLPHVDPPPKLFSNTCDQLNCEFEESDHCSENLKYSGFRRYSDDTPLGNLHTGIRNLHKGNFIYARGPGTKTFTLRNVYINRQISFEFCLYAPGEGTNLEIWANLLDVNGTLLFSSDNLEHSNHQWYCQRLVLHPNNYTSIEFKAKKLPSQFSYIALDSFKIYDPINSQELCSNEVVKLL
uniref:MAM domain-containing protein n=1 Tax=Parastrongyloides trichosuri TaxID=131310 RepID=A0A0N4Z0J5_PARTI